jgi:hypothetical protein
VLVHFIQIGEQLDKVDSISTAVVMFWLLNEDEKDALNAITEATNKTTIEAAIRKPVLFFF